MTPELQGILPFTLFSQGGNVVITLLMIAAGIIVLSAVLNIYSTKPLYQRFSTFIISTIVFIFIVGFFWICWFHWQIYLKLPLEVPEHLIAWINRQLETVNRSSDYGMALYNAAAPPRYKIPLWIEDEKY